MARYEYLIVGGGMTADAAVRGIRELDAGGSIGLIGEETDPPYNRPPLSKALWKGEPVESVWRNTSDAGVDLHLGRRATALYPGAKRVVDDRGGEYAFGKLLLATGGAPRRLPFGGEDVIYFRTLDDYRRLRALAEQGKRFAVIGGGFIGSEIAAALALQGNAVTLLFPEDGIGARVFPRDLARFLVGYFGDHGVAVRAGEGVIGVGRKGSEVEVQTKSGLRVSVDAVVAGIGIVANSELARLAGLPVSDGIVVDDGLRAGHPDVFAAGDVARFRSSVLGAMLRVEHEDNANTMGRLAGRAMAGDTAPYQHLPFFYSDLFELGYEAVGELDPNADVVADWREPFRQGAVYYLAGRKVRGVLLWNVWGQVDKARSLIAQPGPFRPDDLRGLLTAA